MPHPLLPPDFWQNERKRLLAILLPHLEDAARHGAASGLEKYPRLVFDNDLHNAQAAAWARQHADELIGLLQGNTERTVGDILDGWINTSGATMGDLKAALRAEFTGMVADRADNIAVTEVTRAYAEGEKTAYQAAGVKRWQWRTNRDELVCKVCGPLSGKIVDIGQPFGQDRKGKDITEPPAHPRCRCWVAPVVGKAERPAPSQVQPNIPVAPAALPVADQTPRSNRRANIDDLSDAQDYTEIGGVRVTAERLKHALERHPESTAEVARAVFPKAISAPQVVQPSKSASNAQMAYVQDDSEKWWVVVICEGEDGGRFVLTFHRVHAPGK